MAVSFDDKMLGEKAQYYCSSSEDEEEEEEDGGDERDKSTEKSAPSVPEPNLQNYQGYCTNTGPKGVITDWREYKRLETEKREDQERQRLELAKKLCLTCRSELNDDDKANEENCIPPTFIVNEFEDEFLKEYRKKRIAEMTKTLQQVPTFGKLIYLQSSREFLEAIDKENPHVTVIVHIFEEHVPSCDAMNGCLMCLAQEYPTVKFCKMKASTVRLSMNFAEKGVPALLIYKNGTMVGNFVRMSDEFGEDFFATEIESFLQEHGFLSANSKDLNSVIRDKNSGDLRTNLPEDDDSGSDFDVD